ncbi:hypothetical protein IWW57_002780, partial [Coemansia sp. S610]
SEDDEPDNVSVASSCDRGGLGLGGSRSSLAKKSPEAAPSSRQRVFESKLNTPGEQGRPASRGSMMSGASDMAYGQQQPLSSTHSVMSYHTASGMPVEDETPEQDVSENDRNATVRIKVDGDEIDDQIDDIFSDSDDIVQHEPSYCHTGSGLSTMSSGSVTMQAMTNALSLALPPKEVAQPAISAFPVELPEVTLRSMNEMPLTSKAVEQVKNDSGLQRATSPFIFRDSLYELIMGKSPSRQSGASVSGSVASNTISNGSTFGSSKDNLSLASGGPLRSPTSPTTHISPTSTSFDDNCSPSHTAISSPSNDTAFANLMTSAAVVPEEAVETATGSFAEDAVPTSTDDFAADAFSYDHEAAASDDEALSGSSRSASPVPGPRPDAMSLFASMDEPDGSDARDFTPEYSDDAAVDVDALLESEHERASVPMLEQAQGAGEQFPPPADVAFRAGRIGRRLGRAAAAELLHDDTGFNSEPTFSFGQPKASGDGLDKATRSSAATSEGEPESPLAMDSAEPHAPLTRDKRDQYLQTLINRNTMRGSPASSPQKRNVHAGIAGVIRAASPAFSVSDIAGGSGDEGDNENEGLVPPPTYSFRQRHISKRSEGSIEFGVSRSPSALGVRERSLEGDAPRSRPPSSLMHSREALSVSGASINGRMRASTMNVTSPTTSTTPQARPETPTRKVSPSLAVLKNRSLVSNSPAKLSTANSGSEQSPTAASPATAARVLSLSTSSRVRAMSTPPESRPPSSLLAANKSSVSSARIGRVAALSQNFERQQGNALPHRISIPMRPDSAADHHGVAVASAPLGGHRADFGQPVARSTSISSSHSTGAHGQSTKASRDEGLESVVADAADGGHEGQQQQEEQPQHQSSPPLPPPASGDAPPGGYGAGESGDGNGGDEPSPNPRAMTLEATGTDSNGSTTSHSSSLDASRGLAASAQSSASGGLSAALLIDSHTSADIGSSIFSSTESGKESTPTTSRRDAEAERKNRFKELANRRKSGTLERISNSGVVKARRALLAASEPPSSSSSSSSSAKRTTGAAKAAVKVRFAAVEEEAEAELRSLPSGRFRDDVGIPEVSAVGQTSAAAFFEVPGEGRGRRETDDMASSFSSDDLNLDGLQQANTAALHPEPVEPTTREPVLSSRQSSGGGSGEDSSIHVLSSFDTMSTPESTPLDSAPENTKVGLLAQYNMNQRRLDYRLKRVSGESEQSYLSSGQSSQFAGAMDDVELGFRTLGDAGAGLDGSSDELLVPRSSVVEAESVTEDMLTQEFHTLLPTRPRYTSQALFGLSTVAEEDEESRNASMVASDVHRSAAAMGMEAVPAVPSSVSEMSRVLSSMSTSTSSVDPQRGPEMQERRHEPSGSPARGLRSAMFDALVAAPRPLSLASMQQQAAGLDEGAGDSAGAAAAHYEDVTQSRTPSLGSHSFDPNIVFGYNSEENSTMASRSSFDRSDVFSAGRPSSAGSRVLYMHPMDQPAGDVQDGGYAGDSESRASRNTDPGNQPSSSRWRQQHQQQVNVFTGSTGSIHLGTDD